MAGKITEKWVVMAVAIGCLGLFVPAAHGYDDGVVEEKEVIEEPLENLPRKIHIKLDAEFINGQHACECLNGLAPGWYKKAAFHLTIERGRENPDGTRQITVTLQEFYNCITGYTPCGRVFRLQGEFDPETGYFIAGEEQVEGWLYKRQESSGARHIVGTFNFKKSCDVEGTEFKPTNLNDG